MKRFFLSVLFLLLIASHTAHAQYSGSNIADLIPKEGGLVHVRGIYNHKAPFKGYSNEEVTVIGTDVGGSIPIPFNETFALGVGAQWYMHYFRLHNVTSYYNYNNIYVHNIALLLDGVFFFGDDWFLDLNFSPTISSDMKEFSGHDLQLNFRAMAGWAFHDDMALFFGVGASKEFWTYLPYPMLGLVYRPDDPFFEFEMVLPAFLRGDFNVTSFFSVFIKGEFEGFVWDMKGDGAVPNHFMKMIDTHAGAGLDFEIIPGFHAELWGGCNPYRKYHYKDRNAQSFNVRQKTSFWVEGSLYLTAEIFGY